MRLTQAKLSVILDYNPLTGTFRWLAQLSNRIKVGAVAGSKHRSGYVVICIDRTFYRAQRLAWFYMTGKWPKVEIDHRNHKRDDNRWENLREATHGENQQNRSGANRNNISGFAGVSRATDDKGFFARIYSNGKNLYLGYFPTALSAHQAYLEAKARLHVAWTGQQS